MSVPVGFVFALKIALVTGVVSSGAWYLLSKLYGRERTLSLFVNAGLVIASVAVSLVIAEIGTRVSLRELTTTRDGSSYFSQRWFEGHRAELNRRGFREREFMARRDDPLYRIAVIGDSITYGQGIPIEQRFSNLLEERLIGLGDKRYEVLNFGRPGAESEDHLEILRNVVLPLQPDYILLQWYINDIEGKSKVDRPRPWRLVPSDFMTQLLHRYSALYYLLNERWVSLQQRWGLIESYEEYLMRKFGDENSADSSAARDLLERFIVVARQGGIPVGVVVFPPFWHTRWFELDYPPGVLIDRTLRVCKQWNVTCLDLREGFRHVKSVEPLWASTLDAHPGPRANRMVADDVLQVFAKQWHVNTGVGREVRR